MENQEFEVSELWELRRELGCEPAFCGDCLFERELRAEDADGCRGGSLSCAEGLDERRWEEREGTRGG